MGNETIKLLLMFRVMFRKLLKNNSKNWKALGSQRALQQQRDSNDFAYWWHQSDTKGWIQFKVLCCLLALQRISIFGYAL